MAHIEQLPLGPMQTNCYLLADEATKVAAIIDPSGSGQRIAQYAKSQGWQVAHVLLTHSHADHVLGLADLKTATGAPVYIHPEAIEMLRASPRMGALIGLAVPAPPEPDEMLSEGQIVSVGELSLHVLYTPGHAPGHVSFHLPSEKVLFDGDVLFQGSIGRTDLVGGDYETLLQTIREKLLTLPDETRVLSGHGPETTIGEERRRNPFLR